MTNEQTAYKIKRLQQQIHSLCCKIKNISVVYQSNSNTFPQNLNVGSWLIVTDDGTKEGNVLEMWIFNGEGWSEIPTSSSSLPQDVIDALLNSNSPSESNPFATISDITSGSDITVVNNYSALPDPTTVATEFYWVSNSQGTKWLPGSLGGTYYPKGLYYSNGTSWEYIETPYQATQEEVNIGTNNDKFVTPSTLNNSIQWSTKENVITSGTTSQYWRGDKTFQTLDKTAVGLSNVDNTSDANKPISTATQTALNDKQNTLVSGFNIRPINGNSILGSTNLVIPASEIIVLFKSTTQTIVTGKTVETSIYSIPLPNDGFDYMIRVYSQAQTALFGGSLISHRLRVGSFLAPIDGASGANSIGLQSQIAGNNVAASNTQFSIVRNFIYRGGSSGSIIGASISGNVYDDAIVANPFTSLASKDFTIQHYLYVSFNPNSGSAVIQHNQILITAIKL